MTNGEKLVKVFPDIELYKKMHGGIQIDFDSTWWNAEYKESTTKNDLGVDCISRQAVIDLMMQKWGENFSGDDAMQESIDAIRVLPSVTSQEPKTGHWDDIPKYKDIAWQCSECEHFTTMKRNYCPYCGAKMVEP